ncbi:DJ-1/PfpI family protein [Candidatus Babeliales bacterium]|nr:DJ-1/PfpI family protein [Candidatus Babeliales bacterium]
MSYPIIFLVIASNGYQQIEYETTKKFLEKANFKVVTASDKPGAVSNNQTPAIVDITLDNISTTAYDGIFFIGGSGALDHLDIPLSYHLLSEAHKHNKIYGAICIAPRILAKAGVLKGKHATGWNGDNALPGIFDGYDVTYVDKPVVRDGNIITASGPQASADFAQEIINIFRL